MEKIRELISEADVIIADVTEGNPNVLFELGFAMGANKEVLVISQDRVALPVLTPKSCTKGVCGG